MTPMFQRNNGGPIGYGQFAPRSGYNTGGGQPAQPPGLEQEAVQMALGANPPPPIRGGQRQIQQPAAPVSQPYMPSLKPFRPLGIPYQPAPMDPLHQALMGGRQ